MAPPNALRYTRIPLNNGSGAIPAVGFGTLIPDPLATKQATETALEVGFGISIVPNATAMRKRSARRCSTFRAGRFGRGTSSSPRSSGTPTTARAREARLRCEPQAAANRLCRLLSHPYPFAFRPGDEQDPRDERGQVIYDSGVTLVETWRALERLVDDGQCKSIGLSDVTLDKLREIVAAARIKPAVVQVESHPYLPEWELLDFCRAHGIVLLAFAALGHGLDPKLLDDPVITAIAQRVHKTPAQVALAWPCNAAQPF